jgi:SAM-dependent methyltransferase
MPVPTVDTTAVPAPDNDNPWSWMQPQDAARLGEVIMDPAEQQRWCLAMTLGGLPFMWRKQAAPVRDMAYARLALKPGDKVLLLGESVRSCGFEDDLRARVGPAGEIQIVDVQEQARDAVTANLRGRDGRRGTWRYDYTSDIADGHFDAVAVMQGVGHTDDWRDTGTELLRVIKTGGAIVLAEISFNPRMEWIKELDLHVGYWLTKMVAGARGPVMTDLAYYSPADLHAAFDGLVTDPGHFSWRGLDVFWGTKP